MIRETIQNLKPYTHMNSKVVERAGRKLVESLHKSNPWVNPGVKGKNAYLARFQGREKRQHLRSAGEEVYCILHGVKLAKRKQGKKYMQEERKKRRKRQKIALTQIVIKGIGNKETKKGRNKRKEKQS